MGQEQGISWVFPSKFIRLLAVLCLTAPAAARAEAPNACAAPPLDAIVTLSLPKLGTPPLWSAFYERDGASVRTLGGAPLSPDTLMAVERTVARNGTDNALVFAVLNNRGRLEGHKEYPLRGGDEPVAMLALDGAAGGYAVLSNLPSHDKERGRVRVALYDRGGAYRTESVLSDTDSRTNDLTAQSLVLAEDGKGFLAAVEASRPGYESDQFSLLYRFDENGRLLWTRSYKPGVPSRIYGALALEDEGWLLFGDIMMPDKRWAGMAMQLRPDGSILWQQSYPRGKAAALRYAAVRLSPSGTPFYYFLGETAPEGSDPQALWLLALDGRGEAVGQRYYQRPDTAYSALAATRLDDGRFILAANAEPNPGSRQPPHIRILTLSPRTELLADESYVEGVAAQGAIMTFGVEGRILAATVRVGDKPLDIEMDGRGFRIREDVLAIQEAAKMTQDGENKDDARSDGSVSKDDEAQEKAQAQAAIDSLRTLQQDKRETVSTSVVPVIPPMPPVYKGWAVMLPPSPPYNDPCLPPP